MIFNVIDSTPSASSALGVIGMQGKGVPHFDKLGVAFLCEDFWVGAGFWSYYKKGPAVVMIYSGRIQLDKLMTTQKTKRDFWLGKPEHASTTERLLERFMLSSA